MEFAHIPVLFEETIENLNIRPDGIYVDGTLGGAGHSHEIAKRLTNGGRLIGIDQDLDAIAAATKHLEEYKDRVTIVHDNYEHIPEILRDLGIDRVNGILLDLGVSSYQLDNPERGFSYNTDEPLDMRMDRESAVSARTIVNTYDEAELTRILRDYGEERFAARIAANIVKEREKAPLETTGQLVKIIRASIPMKMQEKYGNPCKRTFQAIRIAVNDELGAVAKMIETVPDKLAPEGRLCVISFHSLEDRIVKETFAKRLDPCICPPDFPVCTCGRKADVKKVTGKPIEASEKELEENPRARSAKLRIIEKI